VNIDRFESLREIMKVERDNKDSWNEMKLRIKEKKMTSFLGYLKMKLTWLNTQKLMTKYFYVTKNKQ